MGPATERFVRAIPYSAGALYVNFMGIVIGLVGFYRDYRFTGPGLGILFYYMLVNMYYFFHGKTPRWAPLHHS